MTGFGMQRNSMVGWQFPSAGRYLSFQHDSKWGIGREWVVDFVSDAIDC